MEHNRFKTSFAHNIFRNKYAQGPDDSWDNLADRLVEDVCGSRWGTENKLMSDDERKQLSQYIKEMKFMPGGRYLYYAGRPFKAYNNCYLLRAEEDTREEWSSVTWRAMSCLMTGGGIGIDYSRLRPSGKPLSRTGGKASGPIPLMHAINEIGRNVMQGGSRRSAIYASLNWQHEDIQDFLKVKNWSDKVKANKAEDFNSSAPLDMTNISVNYDDAWLNKPDRHLDPVFLSNVRQAMETGEPGFSFNFGAKQNETLRNACVTGETPILTKEGYFEIDTLVDTECEVWNGTEWSKVTPFSTGEQAIYKVELSDGSYLDCTDNHVWLMSDGSRVETYDLVVGSKLLKSVMPVVHTSIVPPDEDDPCLGYSQGFYSGDGNTGYNWSWVYDTKYCCLDRLKGFYGESNYNRVRWDHGTMLDKNYVPLDFSTGYKLNWLAGLMDSDGTVLEYANSCSVQIGSIDKDFLVRTRLMLTSLGCSAKVTKAKTGGYRTIKDKEYYCQDFYRLLINTTDLAKLVSLGLVTERLKFTKLSPQRDDRQFVYVVSVEDTGEVRSTYCFNEPKNHSGVFNGILTGNCTEVTSEDDSDVCNLGSINLGNIVDINEFKSVVELASKFLVCGTLRADLPYDKVYKVREKNRRLGLGLMGIHEWLLKRGYSYEVTPELHEWLKEYKDGSERSANEHCDRLFISHPVAYRAIAPTGSIGLLAGTSTGVEPLFAVAYKRRYLTDGTKWKYEYVVDSTADLLIREYNLAPEGIDTAYKLSHDYERRIKFQADIQDYVDMSISSTINLPSWGSKGNSEQDVQRFAETLSKFAPRLRGFTCYPDGSRGGQPLTEVPYEEAMKHKGVVFAENDICDISGKGGTCGG